MKVHLIRHARVEAAEGCCIGQTDLPAGDGTRAVFERLAARWEGPRPARIVASDLARSREAARVLAAAWDRPLAVDARLRELHFGRWEGRAWAEIEAADGPALQAWMTDWVGVPPPGGESFRDLLARTAAALAELARSKGDVAVVAHAGTVRAAVVHVLGLDPAHAFRIAVDHAAVTTLGLEPPMLFALNRLA